MSLVVVGEELLRVLSLLGRVKARSWQAGDVDGVARQLPVNLLHRGVIHHPALDPAIESRHHRFIGIVGIARRERLEAGAWCEGYEPSTGISGAKAPMVRITPTRSMGSMRGAELEPPPSCEIPAVRCDAEKPGTSMRQWLANKMPPSGRNRMQAPMERPHASQVLGTGVEG